MYCVTLNEEAVIYTMDQDTASKTFDNLICDSFDNKGTVVIEMFKDDLLIYNIKIEKGEIESWIFKN